MGFPDGSVVTAQPANAGNAGWIPGWQRSPGGGNGSLLSILAWKTPRTEGAWQAPVDGVAKELDTTEYAHTLWFMV